MDEAIAFNYYNLLEESFPSGLAPDLWLKYIDLSNELTGYNTPRRKNCKTSLRRAHLRLSDYFKK
jgi:hypothetical protein